MRRRYLGILLFLVSCFSASFISAERARADVFQCEHQGAGPQPALVCKDSGAPSKQGNAWVTLRKMPAWDTHAGLTIIDICLNENDDDAKPDDDTLFLGEPPALKGLSGTTARSCKRRYCTDKKKAFLFMLNTIPVPVGWSVVSFRIGKKSQSFSISCDEFRESDWESTGEEP
ncbi:MAG: hypothetical protein RIR26_1568 [Pseudomonadota bacterium]|jgi:hypothetical protein